MPTADAPTVIRPTTITTDSDAGALIGRTVTISCHTGTVREASHSTITGRWGIALTIATADGVVFHGVMYGADLLIHAPTAA